MLSRRITSADLATVGQVDRHRLRNLLKSLPEFAARGASERVAVEYTRNELTVVAVLCELERMGLRKDAIAKWVSPIQRALLGPRSITGPLMLLTFDPPEAALLEGPSCLSAGVVVDLDKILRLVDNHCTGVDDIQRELEFGPQSVTRPSYATKLVSGRRHG